MMRASARANSPSVIAWSRSPIACGALPAQARACVPSSTMPSLKQASTAYHSIADEVAVGAVGVAGDDLGGRGQAADFAE